MQNGDKGTILWRSHLARGDAYTICVGFAHATCASPARFSCKCFAHGVQRFRNVVQRFRNVVQKFRNVVKSNANIAQIYPALKITKPTANSIVIKK
jgi:adenylosuccinate lyase